MRTKEEEVSVKSYRVFPCGIQDIRRFVIRWHYSKSLNGVQHSYCFKLIDQKEKLIGAILFGNLGMAGVWKKYVDKEEDIIELRRLCCIDETEKNTESFFISKCIKWLKKHTDIKKIISYADETHGHVGIVYRAANFKEVGHTTPGRVIIYKGKRFHDKAIRAYYNGQLKPFALELKTALEKGDAKYEDTKIKHIYIFELGDRIKHKHKFFED